ncbi:MAG: Mu-like prophage major head subunit gpT family protein [Roseinatronobacter sp.]
MTRKAIINDDLNAFARWSEMMGRAAAEAEIAQLMALLLQASGTGPVMSADGVRLFHASHGNLASPASALSEESQSAARLAMRTMKGLDGKTPIAATPRYLLVSPELETQAEKLLTAIQPAANDDVNPFAGRLSLLVEPRLTGNARYVFADPAVMPVLEVAYLASAPGPQLSSRDG